MACQACNDPEYGFICPSCKTKALVWAAKQALAEEQRSSDGTMTLTIDPRSIIEQPIIDLGKQTPEQAWNNVAEKLGIARGLGDAEILGITPDVLGSNVEPADNPFYAKPKEKQP